jgi:hypothetical protein
MQAINPWTIQGSQNQAEGQVNKNKAHDYVMILQLLLMSDPRIKGISFNFDALPTTVKDTHSAMALTVAKKILKNTDYCSLGVKIVKIAPKFFISSQKFRDKEAAVSTIACSDDIRDESLYKMASIGHLFRLRIVDFPDPFLIESYNGEYLQDLKDGVYVIRLTAPVDNVPSLEAETHTLVLMKEGTEEYLYDPNNGFQPISNRINQVMGHLNQIDQLYDVPCGRIYKVVI